MTKQIEIKTNAIQRFFKRIFYSYLIAFLLVLCIQHFGEFSSPYSYKRYSYDYSSPLANQDYETSLSLRTSFYYETEDSYGYDNKDMDIEDYNYFQKLIRAYIPSMFKQLLLIQIILTILFMILISIKKYLRKNYTIKFT
ncbi:hypothetical protein ACPDHQ_12050 [Myroides odoratimimus]|uniref:hypothetical protein n=1 Tax=Myroides odoratimimus TaxID=76832 RepID=UPI003D2F7976